MDEHASRFQLLSPEAELADEMIGEEIMDDEDIISDEESLDLNHLPVNTERRLSM